MDRSDESITLDLVLSRRGIDLEEMRVDAGGTIIPPDRSLPDNIAELIAALPLILDSGDDPTTRQLEMGRVLGVGGMGEVRLAEQVAMRRPVAVKVQHAAVESPTATLQLLREARVTGFLEHPNIVPVHALGRDAKGRPHIVMKRIEGEEWSGAIVARPAANGDENLAVHINTLLQVIRAVSFAHSRGVLHLDIKPDNVMIGSVGEVYLVDWGVAVRLSADVGHPEVPLAAHVEHIVGTPQYMAPELVAAEGEHLSVRTDVYLLGACLHEILTGEPPHDGTSLRAVFTRAFLSSPHAYDDSWPRELTHIAHRAMNVDPLQRYAGAAELAEALEAFLNHRHGRQLAEDARERLRHLESMLDAVHAERAKEGPSAEVRAAIYDTFSACRFGYDLALRAWPDNSRARRGLQRCLGRMIGFELRHGSAKAAASYLAELPEEEPQLAQNVQRAQKHETAKGQAFERLRRDADVTVGDRLRGIVSLITGVTWGVLHLYLGSLHRDPDFTLPHSYMVATGLTFLVFASAVTFAGRRVFLDTAANTRLAVSYITVFVGYTAIWLVAARVGIALPWALSLFLVCSTMVWTVLALTSDRRLLPLPAALASTILAISVLPNYAFELFGLASLVGPAAVSLMWLRKK